MSDASEPQLALRSTYLGTLDVAIDRFIEVGRTPLGVRRFAVLGEGTLKGPMINAKVLPGGSDLLLRGSDGAGHPDVRLAVETDDGAIVLVTYQGIRVVADGREDYWRCTPTFHTSSDKYGWLNGIIAVAKGRMGQGGVVYDIFQID
jgi:hypothetical protein